MTDEIIGTRIDRGVKRGPRNPHKAPTRRPEHKVGTIPPNLDPDSVLDRYLTESTTSQIAYDYGVSRKTLVRWLVEQRPEQWKKIQVIRALCRKEDGDEGIEVACDALSLARAREQLRSGQWDLERLDSKNYAPKQEVTVVNEIKIDSVLEGSIQALIERVAAKQQLPQVIDLPADAVHKGDPENP